MACYRKMPTCPCKYEPIVLPARERVCNCYYPVEQPVIVPCNTRIVNHFVPRAVYYPQYTTTEESVCEGKMSDYQSNNIYNTNTTK